MSTNDFIKLIKKCPQWQVLSWNHACKNQKLYLKINIYLSQASTLPFKPVLPLYRNQSTPFIRANKWGGFYTMATLDWNKLILTTTFSKNYFILSWRNPSPLSQSVQPNQTYLSQKHKTKNENWKFSKQ